jgi:DNA-binding NarL/FixJ family response regulator/signal transduction histidine kinase
MQNQTKLQLINKMKAVSRKCAVLAKKAERCEETERNLQKSIIETRERAKELECLYAISKIVEKNEPLPSMIQEIVNLIPDSWQHPEITHALIDIEGITYMTDVFEKSSPKLCFDIKSFGKKTGFIEVYCSATGHKDHQEHFLQSEIHLLKAISEQLGKLVERKKIEEELKTSHEKLRKLFDHMQAVREAERKRISHDIHNEVGQALTALKIDLNRISSLKRPTEDILHESFKTMISLIDTTLENIQRIVCELSPVLLEHFGLEDAVIWYSGEFQKRTGITCKVLLNIKKANIDRELAAFFYRIIQELLTNVARHSKATRVTVKLFPGNNRLLLEVVDNGIGITGEQIAAHSSFGLMSLQERINYHGGEVIIRGIQNKGTSITVALPYDISKNDSKINILIVEDHPITREGLKKIIAETPDMTVTGEASSGLEALNLIWNNRYDVVLLDISLPDRNGLEILQSIKARRPELPVLMLSMHPEEQYAVRTLKAGASGYLSKQSLANELLKAIKRVAEGRRYVSSSLAESLAASVNTDTRKLHHETLSNREFMIMRLLATGKTVSEIAEELSISPKTVFTHRSHILEKMNLKGNAEIVRYAVENHLI